MNIETFQICMTISMHCLKLKCIVTSPPSGSHVSAFKYLEEGVHLLLDPIDKPPLDHKAVGQKIMHFNFN